MDRRVLPHMLPAKRRWWRTSPRTSSERRPTRSRRRVQPRLQARVRTPGGSSADGSVNSSPARSANWSWMISGCETTSAGRRSTADQLSRSICLPKRLSISRVIARKIQFLTVLPNRSKSFASLLYRLSHESVLSTIQRFGKTTNFFWSRAFDDLQITIPGQFCPINELPCITTISIAFGKRCSIGRELWRKEIFLHPDLGFLLSE